MTFLSYFCTFLNWPTRVVYIKTTLFCIIWLFFVRLKFLFEFWRPHQALINSVNFQIPFATKPGHLIAPNFGLGFSIGKCKGGEEGRHAVLLFSLRSARFWFLSDSHFHSVVLDSTHHAQEKEHEHHIPVVLFQLFASIAWFHIAQRVYHLWKWCATCDNFVHLLHQPCILHGTFCTDLPAHRLITRKEGPASLHHNPKLLQESKFGGRQVSYCLGAQSFRQNQ